MSDKKIGLITITIRSEYHDKVIKYVSDGYIITSNNGEWLSMTKAIIND